VNAGVAGGDAAAAACAAVVSDGPAEDIEEGITVIVIVGVGPGFGAGAAAGWLSQAE